MPNVAAEQTSVQDPLVQYADAIGWKHVPRDEAETRRRGLGNPFFYDTLRGKLLEFNPGVVTVDNADEVIARLENVRASIEGNADMLAWLRGARSVFVAAEKRQRNVRLIDFDNVGNNDFHVTDEWEFTNGLGFNDNTFAIYYLERSNAQRNSLTRFSGAAEDFAVTKRNQWNDANEFRQCVKEWAAQIRVQPRVVTIRPMKRKWGSCSTEGRLTFNRELLEESREFAELVIVEELLHLRVPNHGKLFRALLKAYLPNWETVSRPRCKTK